MDEELLIFTGNSNISLANKIASEVGKELSNCTVGRFPDGEISIKIEENVRGRDIFLIQSICRPVNENLMEILMLVDAIHRASAGRITCVIPYFGYARQDRKDRPRVPITAKLIADMFTVAGADHILTMDLHAGQIQGFFSIPLDNITAIPIFTNYIVEMGLKDVTIVAPDAGAVKIARNMARILNVPIAVVDKIRKSDMEVRITHVIGDVKDRNVILVDDIISTGGTIVESASVLKEKGAKEVFAFCTHPVFAGDAVDKLSTSVLKEVVVTDTIPVDTKNNFENLKILSVSEKFAEAINSIHTNESISEHYDQFVF
jgi:ribose-phosphate pyrophosphokinase